MIILSYDECTYPGKCQNLNTLMASSSSTGIQVILTSTEDGSDSPPISTTITSHYLPPECRVNHVCDILHFGHPSGTSHYFIPSIRGFVVLSHWADYKDNHTEELSWYSFIGVTENCNPIKAFLARNDRILIIVCVDLQTRPRGSLYYIHYNLEPNSTGGNWNIRKNSALQAKSQTIYNPVTVSEIIHIRGQLRCPEMDNLYFIDDGFVLQFPTSDTNDPAFRESDLDHPLEDCIGYQSLEHYGNDSLIIRCSNNRIALYDSCSTGRFTYAPDDRVPYPCTNWSTVAYINETQLILDGETQQLPSGDINYARCVQGGNHPIFIASSADGVFITRFDGNNFTKITSGNCSNNDNGTCLRPVLLESDLVFVTFDSGSLAIINMTEGCTGDPVIAQFPIPFQPDLTSVSLGQRSYDCSCSALQITEPPPTSNSILDVSEPAANNQTEYAKQPDSTMESSPTSSHQVAIYVGSVLSSIIVFAVIVFTAIIM